MSPIRASERGRYPRDWYMIRGAILQRAGQRCECDGRCESHRCHAYGFRLLTGGRARCRARNGEAHPSTGSRVVLTIAHLDHTPENCEPVNLLALCQACHLSYDREHHAATRAATLAARKAGASGD